MIKRIAINNKPTIYFIDTKGNIFGKTGKLKPFTNEIGYKIIGLWLNSKRTNKRIHRLVAQAFIPNPYNKPCVNHINGIKADNRLENLEWATHKENTRHSIENGFSKNNGYLLDKDKEIINLYKNCYSIKDIAKIYKVSYNGINCLLKRNKVNIRNKSEAWECRKKRKKNLGGRNNEI